MEKVGLRTKAAEDTVRCSAIELRRERRRDSNPQPQDPRRNPRLRIRPTRMSRNATTARHRGAASPGLEPGPPGSEPGVVPVPPARIGLDGEIRTPNLRLPTPARFRVALRPDELRTHGEIRTRTGRVLSAVPLPVGLRERESLVAGAGIEPAGKAYETSLIPDLP